MLFFLEVQAPLHSIAVATGNCGCHILLGTVNDPLLIPFTSHLLIAKTDYLCNCSFIVLPLDPVFFQLKRNY